MDVQDISAAGTATAEVFENHADPQPWSMMTDTTSQLSNAAPAAIEFAFLFISCVLASALLVLKWRYQSKQLSKSPQEMNCANFISACCNKAAGLSSFRCTCRYVCGGIFLLLISIAGIIYMDFKSSLPNALSVETFKFRVHSQDKALPIRLLFLSDFHWTSFRQAYSQSKDFFRQELKQLLHYHSPHVIVLGGDFFDGRRANEENEVSIGRILRHHLEEVFCEYAHTRRKDELDPFYGIFAITGNHEFYAAHLLKVLESAAAKQNCQIQFLKNRIAFQPHWPFAIYGVDDLNRPNNENFDHFFQKEMDAAIAEIFRKHSLPPTAKPVPVVMLAHRPDFRWQLEQQAKRAATVEESQLPVFSSAYLALIISGHTHGGQFRFPLWNWWNSIAHTTGVKDRDGRGSFLYYWQRFYALFPTSWSDWLPRYHAINNVPDWIDSEGLHRIDRMRSKTPIPYLYVSRGLARPDNRWNCPPEATLIQFISSKSTNLAENDEELEWK